MLNATVHLRKWNKFYAILFFLVSLQVNCLRTSNESSVGEFDKAMFDVSFIGYFVNVLIILWPKWIYLVINSHNCSLAL